MNEQLLFYDYSREYDVNEFIVEKYNCYFKFKTKLDWC